MKSKIFFTMSTLSLIISTLLVLACCWPWLPHECRRSGGVVYCSASLVAISVLPERYDGYKVMTSGYLAISDGYLFLFPSEESYRSGMVNDRVMVDLGERDLEGVVGKFDEYLYRYVHISGFFKANPEEGGVYVGVLVDSSDLISTFSPENKEGWGELKVPLSNSRGK